MSSVDFISTAGERVHLGNAHPGGGNWQVLINGFYQGDIYKKDGKWRGHLNAKSQLTSDDIDAMGERIDIALKAAAVKS